VRRRVGGSLQFTVGGFSRHPQNLVAAPEGRDPAGTRGLYRVVFTLRRPGVSSEDPFNVTFDAAIPGDSFIQLPTEQWVERTAKASHPDSPIRAPQGSFSHIRIRAATPDGDFVFDGFPNEHGRLGRIVTEFHALNFNDAELRAHRALNGSLSLWSVELDVPIEIARVHLTELATGGEQVSWMTPQQNVPLAINPVAQPSTDLRGYASLYREAVNSNSPAYRFLCLFKIIDAIQSRRGRLGAEARAAGTPFIRPIERFPEDPPEFAPWLNAIFHPPRDWDDLSVDAVFLPEVRGRRFRWAETDLLNPVRVKVAHALASGARELTMSSDELLHVREVDKWLPVATCMVRRMLKNEFPNEFLPFVPDPPPSPVPQAP
jgi:hypothetical protein